MLMAGHPRLVGLDPIAGDALLGLSQANLALAPQQLTYLATAAFMLFMQNRPAESLALLQPHVAEVPTSLPLKFAYGLALAGTGEKITARIFLDTLPPASLTEREVEIIKAALAPR